MAACGVDYSESADRRRPNGASPKRAEALGPRCHYVVVRRDLPFGIIAANIVHAAGESSPGDVGEGTFAVVLQARDELHLTLVAEQLEAAGVPLVRVHEPDPPYNGQLMALGLVPARKELLRRQPALSSLPLLR